MNANWYGVLPRWVRQKFGHVGTEMIGGDRRLRPGPPRRALRDHRGVRLGLPAASAAPRRLRDPRPRRRARWSRRPASTRSRATERGPRSSSYGLVEPALLVRHRQPRRDHPARTTRDALNDHVRLTGRPGRPRARSTSCATASAASPATTTSASGCASRGSSASRTSPTIPQLGRGDPRRLRRRHRPRRPPGRAARRAAAARASASATRPSGSSS